MSPETSVQALLQALQVFSGQPDKASIDTANRWLQDFQHSPEAWVTCNYLLMSPESPAAARTFAAQTIRAKVTFDLQQVEGPQRLALRTSLLSALQKFAAGPRVVTIQICLSLAGLALQMLDWDDPVAEIIQTLGHNPQLVPSLLQFLTVLPEEVSSNSRIPLSNDEYQIRTPQLLTDKADQVIKLLTMYIQAPGVTSEIQAQIFRCVRSWIVAGEVNIIELAESPLFSFSFQALRSDALFEDAVDVICDVIHETQEIDDYMTVIERIVVQLLELRPAVPAAHDDAEKMRGYCRIFTEAGETYRLLILTHPETFFPIVETIAECAAYPDLDVVQITFNFWYRLAQSVKKRPSVPSQFQELYKGLLDVMIGHLHFPSDGETMNAQERDDFRAFRHVMGDTLKDCCYVLGSAACLKAAYDKVALAVSQASPNWQEIEAPLFSMRSMGAEVNPNDNEVVPLIMDMIPKLPSHPQVRYAATLVICRYTEWVDLHPQYIEYQLAYISTGFESSDSQVSAAAGQAMKYLCKDCKRHLVPYLPQLHTFVGSIGQKLQQDDRIQIYEAIAYVISSLPMDEAAQALSQFALEIIARVHFKAQLPTPSKEQIQQTAEELEEVEIMLKVVQGFGEDLPPSCKDTVQDVWRVLDGLLQRQGAVHVLAERVCSTLRAGLEFFGLAAKPVVPSLLERLSSSFETTGFASYVWIVGKAVRLFGNEEGAGLRHAFRSAFERVSQQVFALLKVQAPEDVPDVLEDYVHYLIVMLEFAPDILFVSPSFADGFRVALSALTMYHGEIVWPAVEFLTGVLQHDCLNAPPPRSPTPPNFPAYAATIRTVVELQGFSLVGFILTGLLTHFDETTSIATTVLFKRLADLWPQQLLAWLTTALEQLSSASVTPATKANLVSEFAAAINNRQPERVKPAIMSLHFTTKRNRDRSRLASLEV